MATENNGSCKKPGCCVDNSTGNGWFCKQHCEESMAELNRQREERLAAIKAKRSEAARQAAITRKLNDGSTFRNGSRSVKSFASAVWGERKRQAIRFKVSRTNGWI